MSTLKRSKSKRCDKGFTLLELIIAIAVSIIAAGLTFLIFAYSVRGIKEARTISENDFELAKAYIQMRRQIISAYEPDSFEQTFQFEKSNDERSDFFRFITEASETGDGTVEACYFVASKNDNKYLAYSEYPFPRKFTDENKEEAQNKARCLSEKITGMKVRFKQDGNILEEAPDNLPEIIIITLYYKEGENEKSMEFSARPGIR